MKKNCIEIINVGPIRKVNIELNKFNIFMGKQSSGKSTIAKIISFCHWVEKDVALHQSFDEYNQSHRYFIDKLETFHNLKGYFNENSVINFESQTIKINYSYNNFNISWVDKYSYKRNKISYIPSERTYSILPEVEKLELDNNYLKSFLFDWLNARKFYPRNENLSILDIGVNYYYSESSKENHILDYTNAYDILLSNASSGLQSVTPLIVMTNHLINNIYKVEQLQSYEFDEVKARVTQSLISELVIIPMYGYDVVNPEERKKIIEELNKKISEKDPIVLTFFKKFDEVRSGLFRTHSTNLIIEEPEQNLFPATQRSLIYYLLKNVNKDASHHLTITTHSPYVLYAINNCIMASIVSNQLSAEEKASIRAIDSAVNPDLITIYEIQDGLLNCIQQSNGLIGENFFDNQMKETMDDFYIMLNHYN